MKRALVIGSEGNIGGPLSTHLRDIGMEVMEADIVQGWRPNYMVVDINQPVDLLQAFDWNPDVVFILSAMVSRVTCEQAGGLAVTTNLSGINNILQLCKRSNAMTVYFSTSEVYGPDCKTMSETELMPNPNNRYGLTKLMGEKLVEYEVHQHGLRAVTLRPFMIYDENETIGDHRSAMIRFAYNLATGKPIEIHRGAWRGWMHISDAVNAITASMYVREYSVINIGHPDIRPIDELAETIRTQLDASPDLISVVDFPQRMTAVKRPVLDRQKEILGIEPKVSFDEGVRRVCDTIKSRIKQKD